MFFPERLAALCDICRGEVYSEDLVHIIDGFIVCPDCFYDFVFSYFEDCLVLGRDIAERMGHGKDYI